jgi:hypothetical protein
VIIIESIKNFCGEVSGFANELFGLPHKNKNLQLFETNNFGEVASSARNGFSAGTGD